MPALGGIAMLKAKFDLSRGVDVMRGKRVVWHFIGPYALAEALDYAAELGGGHYVRYWGVKE